MTADIEMPGSDLDIMRDVYMTATQRAAFDRIAAAARRGEPSYDRELIAEMLEGARRGDLHQFSVESIERAISQLRAADNADAAGVHTASIAPAEAKGDECPNCVSPWKCNGPHIGDAPDHGYDTPQPAGGDECHRHSCRRVRAEMQAEIDGLRQPAGGEAAPFLWLRMNPDGTPDWAEDCVGQDEHFLDSELKSDGYWLKALYDTTQPAAQVQGEAVGEVFGPKGLSTMVALSRPLPPGTKLYTHPAGDAPAVRVDDVLLRVSDEDLSWCKDIVGALQEAGGPANNMRAVGLSRLIAALEAALGQGKGS